MRYSFSQIYECIYEQYASLYSERERQKHLLIRVDSTLASGLQSSVGHASSRKAVKYTMAFDGVLPCRRASQAYRRRWDIEVFFRFLKQELNLSHLLSLNQNGIRVMLWMTLIVAMLLLIYKQAKAIGYRTAKRRFAMEIRNLAIASIVVECGGDLDKLCKT